MPVSKKFLANAFAKFYVRREPSSRRTRSRRTLVRSGCISSRERIFWRTVRQFAAEYGRTRANPGELRRTFAGVRRSVGIGEPLASSREFARVRPSSRRTTVRRVYCLDFWSDTQRDARRTRWWQNCGFTRLGSSFLHALPVWLVLMGGMTKNGSHSIEIRIWGCIGSDS